MEKAIIETLVDKIESLLQEAYEETRRGKYYNKGIKDCLSLIRQESARQRKQEEYFSKESTMEKEINIVATEGYEIDKENSTFECIKFKPVQKKRWRDNIEKTVTGHYIDTFSGIIPTIVQNTNSSYNVFATKKQAKSALAMARISQIMANDERFGGIITDKEWNNKDIRKYVILREKDCIYPYIYYTFYHFLAFHTAEQRDLFFQENADLVRDYLML